MVETQTQSNPPTRSNLIGRCIVSCISVILTHLALSEIPRFFSALSFITQLALSALLLLLLLGLAGWFRRTLLRSEASAPAFVFFNVLFVWVFYLFVIRPAVPQLNDAVFNCGVCFSLLVSTGSLQVTPALLEMGLPLQAILRRAQFLKLMRLEVFIFGVGALGKWFRPSINSRFRFVNEVRYCKTCKAYIKGLDHHCPAFGNCIGQNNHLLFLILLSGFIGTEASYLVCSSLFAAKSGLLDRPSALTLSENLVVSTILFTILQLLWQVLFVMWHIYCVCANIRTDEWIKWKKYPEFQLVSPPEPGQSFTNIRFWNPYDKDIVQNLKEFLALSA